MGNQPCFRSWLEANLALERCTGCAGIAAVTLRGLHSLMAEGSLWQNRNHMFSTSHVIWVHGLGTAATANRLAFKQARSSPASAKQRQSFPFQGSHFRAKAVISAQRQSFQCRGSHCRAEAVTGQHLRSEPRRRLPASALAAPSPAQWAG